MTALMTATPEFARRCRRSIVSTPCALHAPCERIKLFKQTLTHVVPARRYSSDNLIYRQLKNIFRVLQGALSDT